jgi:stage II sporulation protein P
METPYNRIGEINMLTEKRSTKIGAAILIFALVLRLLTGPGAQWGELFSKDQENTLPKLPQLPALTAPIETLPLPSQPILQIPAFGTEDLTLTPLRYSCGYRPDVEKLLRQELRWSLDDGQPAVLIVHTHGSESYTREKGQTYEETAKYRTLDTDYNMVAVGDLLARLLEEAGIRVIHDRQTHDYPSYNSSYNNSRKSVKEYLQEYPSIRLVLDVHRDALERADGSQIATGATVGGEKSAQIMFLVGTDESGNYHPDWKDNLALATKLNVLMEHIAPGITRPSTLRAQRFNQDLGTVALLVEVGAAGNTLTEALRAIPVLAQAIIALKNGANWT